MSDSDDNRPVQKKKPQPRPRPKRSKLLSSPNSTLSSSRTDGSTTNSYLESERAADDFFSSISFTSISQYQETRRQEYEDLTKQDKNELDILDLEAPSIAVDVSPVQDLEDDAEIRQARKTTAVQKEAVQETKRKREVSLTPPPELPTRQYPTDIPITSRPSVPTNIIDLDDDDLGKVDELDPELASIAAKLNSIASQQSMEGASPLSPESSFSQPFGNSPLSQSQPSQPSQPSQSSPSIPISAAGGAAAGATVGSSSSGSNNSLAGGEAAATGTTGSPQQPSSPSTYHTILLVIRMNRHPLLQVPPERVTYQRELERAVQVTVRSNNMFREMMTFYCKMKGVNLASTVFTYSGIRLMPSSTPAGLDFPSRVIIEAYEQNTYKYIKEQEVLERGRKLADVERQAAEAVAAAAAAAAQQQEQGQEGAPHGGGQNDGGQQQQQEEDASVEYIFIKLRGKDTADEKIRVKKTTTVHAIISHYRAIKKIAASTTVKLEFDDEALDSTTVIGDTEVEDDDMLVVRVG